MLRAVHERARRRILTTSYPAQAEAAPPLYRGMPQLDLARCLGHAACADVCPSGAIAVDKQDDGGWGWRLDRARCVACGACAEACPTGAIAILPEFELAVRDRADLVTTVSFQQSAVSGQPPLAPPLSSTSGEATAALASTSADTLGEQLRRRIARLFRASLHVRHLDVGSCNAADWELNATLNPVYDLQRLGIDFVASPRHADMLVVTGAVTRNLAPALWHTYEATPDPKIVVALGTDACGGGVVADSYATAGGVDRCIPVDVYVPGDPPRPQAIIHGLLLALDRREQKLKAECLTVPAPGPRADLV